MNSEELAHFKIKNREFVSKFKFESEKFSRNDIFISKSSSDINSAIETILKNNKTPIIIRSKNNILPKSEVLKIFDSKKTREIDFRHYYLRMREKTNNKPVLEEISKIVQDCIVKGITLLINFDDCCIKYEELFDPDINEFYAPNLFSPLIFTQKDFGLPKNINEHFRGKNLTYDKNFRFILYSKFVVDLSLDDSYLIKVFENRFEKALPIRKICFIVISK